MSKYIKKGVTLVFVGTIICLIVLLIKDFKYLINYADAFTISGFLLIGVGGLTAINNSGGFDMFSYSFKNIFVPKNKRKFDSLYNYVDSKADVRHKNRFNFLVYLVVGAIFLIPGLIMMFLV